MEHKTANIKIRLRPSEYDLLKSKSNNNISKYCRSALLDISYDGPSSRKSHRRVVHRVIL
ncbi:hypothetical protein WSS15_17430 [Acetobacter pasteurianus]|nr:hypothetical protein WSS15_17430 [Acetobacter pasteurianus]